MPQTKRRSKPKVGRSQPRIPGVVRTPMYTAADPRIEKRIKKDQDRYGVSRSFVIAHALAFTFDIDLDYDYR